MAGTTFPMISTTLESSDGITVARRPIEIVALEVVDADTIRLGTNLGPVELTEAGGIWSGTVGGYDFSGQIQDFFPFDEEVFGFMVSYSEGSFGGTTLGVFGYEAPGPAIQDIVDNDIVLGYNGPSEVIFTVGNSLIAFVESGTSNVVVDFDTGAVTGQVFVGGDTTIDIVEGSLSGSTISGSVEVVPPLGDVATTDPGSGFEGRIFGLSGFQAGGVYGGSGSLNGDNLQFIGSFAGFD